MMLESLVVLGMVAGLAIYSWWTGPTEFQRRCGASLAVVILGLIVMIAGRQHGSMDVDVWACLMVALCLVSQWPDRRPRRRSTNLAVQESSVLPEESQLVTLISDSDLPPAGESSRLP